MILKRNEDSFFLKEGRLASVRSGFSEPQGRPSRRSFQVGTKVGSFVTTSAVCHNYILTPCIFKGRFQTIVWFRPLFGSWAKGSRRRCEKVKKDYWAAVKGWKNKVAFLPQRRSPPRTLGAGFCHYDSTQNQLNTIFFVTTPSANRSSAKYSPEPSAARGMVNLFESMLTCALTRRPDRS